MFLVPHLNKIFKIYNGRKFVSIQVKKAILGHYSGDFCMSKYLGRKIHLRKKKKKLNFKK
jgi:ribosomal protein S19